MVVSWPVKEALSPWIKEIDTPLKLVYGALMVELIRLLGNTSVTKN